MYTCARHFRAKKVKWCPSMMHFCIQLATYRNKKQIAASTQLIRQLSHCPQHHHHHQCKCLKGPYFFKANWRKKMYGSSSSKEERGVLTLMSKALACRKKSSMVVVSASSEIDSTKYLHSRKRGKSVLVISVLTVTQKCKQVHLSCMTYLTRK